MATENWEIVGGPSKMDLMLALFDTHMFRPRPVSFSLMQRTGISGKVKATKPSLDVHITCVERPDGTGENWNFSGFTADSSLRKVTGDFRTDHRNGHLIIHDVK